MTWHQMVLSLQMLTPTQRSVQPTRHGILTGGYAWRTRLKNGVTWSYDEHLIDPDRTTIADLFMKHGYNTACIGK